MSEPVTVLAAFHPHICNVHQKRTSTQQFYPVIFSNGDISPQNTFKTDINAP